VLFVPPGPGSLANDRLAPLESPAKQDFAGCPVRGAPVRPDEGSAMRPTGVRGLAAAHPAARVLPAPAAEPDGALE